MKKLALVFMVFLSAISLAQGQTNKDGSMKDANAERTALKKLEGTSVSEIAKNSFKTDFGNVPSVRWKRNGTFDEAVFTKDGNEMTAFYDIEGNMVGMTKLVTWNDLPARGQQEIKKMYKDYDAGPVIFFDDNESNASDMIMYGVQFDDSDTYLVELKKGTNRIVVQVTKDGLVTFFRQL